MDKKSTPKKSSAKIMNADIKKFIDNWVKEFGDNGLSENNLERALRYAKDLGHGLEQTERFAQGVTVFGSARLPENSKWYIKARELGRKLAANGHPVITGGGPSIMEAANRGCFEYGGRSVGLNITLAHEQSPNPYLTDFFEFRYFFARKVMLAMSAKVFVFFPGGFGTMDELTEIIILMQEGKMPKMPVFLVGKSFWKPLDKFYESKIQAMGMIKPKDRKIYKMTDNIDEIVAAANRVGYFPVDFNIYDKFKNVNDNPMSRGRII